jgi:hypothetical protein
MTFCLGSRARSETALCEEGPKVRDRYSRFSDDCLYCVPASLANVVAEFNPEFSRTVVDGTRDIVFVDLRQSSWLTRPVTGRVPYELRNCSPVDIRSQRSRDVYWVLEQEEGDFIVTFFTRREC